MQDFGIEVTNQRGSGSRLRTPDCPECGSDPSTARAHRSAFAARCRYSRCAGFSRDPGELPDRDTMSGRDHAHAWPTLLAEMALLVQDEQVDADRMQLGQERHEILQAAADPVDAPSHDHIELTARRCLAERIRNHCRQWPRNTRCQAGATLYLGRTFTGWIAPALRLAHLLDHLIDAREQRIWHGKASVFAVLRLITSSYLVGACTGRSAGFSPLRMRST
jgi:hypothetical protein